MFGSPFFANLIEATTQRFVGRWTDEEWLSQSAEIETRAADEKRDAPAAFDLLDLLCGLASPFDGGVVDVWRDEVDQVMWNPMTFVERDFGSGYLNFFVDLDRITVDYLAVYFEGDVDPERAFPGSGWAYDGEHARLSITSQMRI